MKSRTYACARAARRSRRQARHAQTDPIADFYKGKTVTIVASGGVGGPIDLACRVVARFLPRHIPGNPTIVVRNMPGGGHVLMSNFMFTQAAKDGTYIGGVVNSIPTHQVIDGRGVRFDAGKFIWLGSTGYRQPDDHGVAHRRLQDDQGRVRARAAHRHDRRRLRHLHLHQRDERHPRHQVQDGDGLQGFRVRRSRDRARRGAGARRHDADRRQAGAAALGRREEGRLPGADRRREGSRIPRRAADARARRATTRSGRSSS